MKKAVLINFIILIIFALIILIVPMLSNINTEESLSIEEEPVIADNIKIEIKDGTLTKEGATIIIINNNNLEIYFSEWYRIDKKKEQEWVKVKKKNNNYFFESFAHRVNGESSIDVKIDWTEIYETLSNGKYRLVKEIDGKFIAVEFTID